MEDTYMGMSETAYLTWLETLGKEVPRQTTFQLPGLLLETSRESSVKVWGHKFFSPLQKLALHPFQGEKPWVEVVCTSWEDASALPRRLAHLCTSAAGLWGSFRGGVLVDFRWCEGTPQKGQLDALVRFLLAGSGELAPPLFLTLPGSAQALQYELRLLDLQQILPGEALTDKLEESLRQVGSLTGEERERILRQAQAGTLECADAMTRTLHRLTAMGRGIDAERLLKQMTRPEPSQRKIGFEREVET